MSDSAITVGHVGWSPDYKTPPRPVGQVVFVRAGSAVEPETSLAQKVAELEKRVKSAEDLAATIIATLRVNRNRGTLTSADDQFLDKLIESWDRQLHQSVT